MPVAFRQIAATRNAGARAALGDAFVFVDADTLIGADVVAGLMRALAGGAIGGGAAIRFDEPVPRWVRWTLPAFLWLFRRLRFTGGCFLFSTRAAFEAVGGFDETLYASEELTLCRALQQAGRVRDPARIGAHLGPQGPHLQRPGDPARQRCASPSPAAPACEDRSRLRIWYGPRRPDPAERR